MENDVRRGVQELFRWMAAQVGSGYGQAEVIFGADNEAVGCRLEVSYDLSFFM